MSTSFCGLNSGHFWLLYSLSAFDATKCWSIAMRIAQNSALVSKFILINDRIISSDCQPIFTRTRSKRDCSLASVKRAFFSFWKMLLNLKHKGSQVERRAQSTRVEVKRFFYSFIFLPLCLFAQHGTSRGVYRNKRP